MLKFKLSIIEGSYGESNFFFEAKTVKQGLKKMKDFLVKKQSNPNDCTYWNIVTTKVTIIKEGVGSFTYDNINSSFSQVLDTFLVAVDDDTMASINEG